MGVTRFSLRRRNGMDIEVEDSVVGEPPGNSGLLEQLTSRSELQGVILSVDVAAGLQPGVEAAMMNHQDVGFGQYKGAHGEMTWIEVIPSQRITGGAQQVEHEVVGLSLLSRRRIRTELVAQPQPAAVEVGQRGP